MKSAIEKVVRHGIALSAITVVLAVVGGGWTYAQAAPVGSPCDTRDECSANPGRYAAYRDDSMIKAREYVADMNWTGGGPPDDAVVLTRVIKSPDMIGAVSCNVRDECVGRIGTWKVVRAGPTGDSTALAHKATAGQVAATPVGK